MLAKLVGKMDLLDSTAYEVETRTATARWLTAQLYKHVSQVKNRLSLPKTRPTKFATTECLNVKVGDESTP